MLWNYRDFNSNYLLTQKFKENFNYLLTEKVALEQRELPLELEQKVSVKYETKLIKKMS